MSAEAVSREEEWCALQARISELLSRHGRNALQGGDYYLVEKDSGTYEQKVLVFFNDALSVDLLMAISELLRDYSEKWRVLFVEANRDGTELTPLGGLKISRYGPEPLEPVKISPEKRREMRALYDSLGQLLGAHGTSNPYGKGDYWIVDDKWTPRSHMVCIFNIEFLSPPLVEELQQLLKRQFPTFVVWFQIEVDDPRAKIPLPGI